MGGGFGGGRIGGTGRGFGAGGSYMRGAGGIGHGRHGGYRGYSGYTQGLYNFGNDECDLYPPYSRRWRTYCY
jgi:hypothetical protein